MSKPQDHSDDRLLLLGADDNVFVLRQSIESGEILCVSGRDVKAPHRLGLGHKIARRPVLRGAQVIKYGAPIGRASADIGVGEHVHLHNLVSDYTPTYALERDDA
jgi:SAF domain